MLDVDYIERYFNKEVILPSGERVPSYNQVHNTCAARQVLAGWRRYQVPQADVKPMFANSISYSFSASAMEVETFGYAALQVAQLWAELVAGPGDGGGNDDGGGGGGGVPAT